MARPPDGLKHVDRLPGSVESKRRLRCILETLTGERSVAEACETLGISEARFHTMRRQALEGALSGLAPRRIGRPPKPPPAGPSRIEQLEQEREDLRMALRAAEIREELAMTMPHVLHKAGPRSEKKSGFKRPRKRGRQRPRR